MGNDSGIVLIRKKYIHLQSFILICLLVVGVIFHGVGNCYLPLFLAFLFSCDHCCSPFDSSCCGGPGRVLLVVTMLFHLVSSPFLCFSEPVL